MTLGEQLKLIREEAGISLDELSETTKIQKKYLDRLENEEYDKLPMPVYVGGFIQKWALACNVDAEPLLMRFHRENKPLVSKSNNSKSGNYLSAPNFIISSRHILSFFVVFGILFLLIYFYNNQRTLALVPEIEILHPQEVDIVTEDQDIVFRGRAENISKVLINTEEVDVVDGQFQYVYGLQAGLNTIIIKAVNKSGQEIEVIRKVLRL